jgi:hypothetical protein
MNPYKGTNPKTVCIKTNKHSTKVVVYLSDKTIVTTVDKDGNIKTTIEPII